MGSTIVVDPYRFGVAGNGPDGTTHYAVVTLESDVIGNTLTNYPLYVDLSDMPANFWTRVSADGGNIRATDSSGATELPVEIVHITVGSSVGEMYVKVPSYAASPDTTIRIYYGGSATMETETDTYGQHAVWSGAHKGVWHMEEASGTRYDSSKQTIENDLTDNNTVTTGTGTVGSVAADFEASNSESLSITNAAQGGLGPSGASGDFAIILLAQRESDHTGAIISKWGTGGNSEKSYRLYMSNGTMILDYHDGSVQTTKTLANAMTSLATWYCITMQIDVSAKTATWYLDGGVQTGGTGANNSATSVQSVTERVDIGQHDGDGTGGLFFDGMIDELRFMTGLPGADWLAAVGTNYMSRASLYTVGAEQTA